MKTLITYIGLGANAALTLVTALAVPDLVLFPAGFFFIWLHIWRAEVRS